MCKIVLMHLKPLLELFGENGFPVPKVSLLGVHQGRPVEKEVPSLQELMLSKLNPNGGRQQIKEVRFSNVASNEQDKVCIQIVERADVHHCGSEPMRVWRCDKSGGVIEYFGPDALEAFVRENGEKILCIARWGTEKLPHWTQRFRPSMS